jgi:hypothetical protein
MSKSECVGPGKQDGRQKYGEEGENGEEEGVIAL